MKLTNLILPKIYKKIFGIALIMLLSITTSQTFAQQQQVQSLTDNQTLKAYFKQVEEQTKLFIDYNTKDIDDTRIIAKAPQGKTVREVMDHLLQGTDCTFTFQSNHIIISKQQKASQENKSKIEGTVTDDTGEPLIGVGVIVKGTTTGTVTDVDGKFQIESAPKDVLVISYVGFITQEMPVQNRKNLEITLNENQKMLDEVIVVGYGIQKKVNLTGAVTTVSAKQLEDRPITSLSAGLQGLVPGMTIVQNSGQPGADGGTIRIRGEGTINNSNPMVLIDGIENSMDNLDYNDIETISVLKDAASASIYGSKAANGVILITTKRGSTSKAVISYSSNFGWQKATDIPKRLNSWEYAELYNEGLILDGKAARFTEEDIQAFKSGTDPYKYPNTNWQDLLYKGSGFQQQHNINISGGTEKARYMASVGYQEQNGIIKLASKKQYNARINLDMTPVDNLDVSLSLNFSNRERKSPTSVQGGVGQFFRLTNQMAPWIPYKDANGYYGTIGDGNPIAWMDQGATEDLTQRRYDAIGSIQYTFIKGLSLKAIGGYKSDNDDQHEFKKDIWYNPSKYHGPNKLIEKTWFHTRLTGDILLNFNRSFGSHNLATMAGFHTEKYDNKESEMSRINFPNNDLTDINAGSTSGQVAKGYTRQLNMISYFGRINYDYMGKYLLEANVRSDASSRFADGYRWGTFPSFSAGWRLSEEGFMEPIKHVLSNLKIRGSWGKLGNQSALEYYPAIPTIGLGKDFSYPFNGSIQPGAAQNSAKKKSISWEKTRTWGLGVDFGLWNNLNVSVDYYDRRTTDILMKIAAPKTFGMDGYIDNVGEMSNKGIEVSANYNNRFGKVDVGVSANFTYNKNEILSLGNDLFMEDGFQKRRQVGYAMNSFYGYKTAGLFKSQEEIDNWAKYKMSNGKVLPGDLKYVDVDKDGEITGNDRVILGSNNPKYTFGFTLSAAYEGFDVQAFFQGAAGVNGYLHASGVGEFMGDTGNPLRFWLDRWTPENPNSNIPRIQNNNGISSPNRVISEYWQQDATYLRMKNLQLGYTFPVNWTKKFYISKLRIYYSGQNLLTFTDFMKGWDPESPIGDGQNYPQVKTNSFGLNITF